MRDAPHAAASRKSLALVLGGGGARGLAHICVLQALDEIGVRPAVIVGSSIGALIGAAYAAGMTGTEIRRHFVAVLHEPAVLRRVFSARAVALTELMTAGFGNPAVINAEKLAALFLPARVPARFEDLTTPLIVSTADLQARAECVFAAGPLAPAVAASLAIPGLIQPVAIGGRILVDGAAINPLPFDLVRGRADVVVAVDAAFAPAAVPRMPSPFDALWATVQLMGHALVAEKLGRGAPDLVLQLPVGSFRLLDFLAVSAILRVADRAKEEVKRRVRELVG